MIGKLFVNSFNLDRAGSIGDVFIPLSVQKTFETQKLLKFFVTFSNLLVDSGICLPFNKQNEVNLKRNHKTK